MPDLACPREVRRPYLNLLADHRACRLGRCRRGRRRWLGQRTRRLHQRGKFRHRRIRRRYLRRYQRLRRRWILELEKQKTKRVTKFFQSSTNIFYIIRTYCLIIWVVRICFFRDSMTAIWKSLRFYWTRILFRLFRIFEILFLYLDANLMTNQRQFVSETYQIMRHCVCLNYFEFLWFGYFKSFPFSLAIFLLSFVAWINEKARLSVEEYLLHKYSTARLWQDIFLHITNFVRIFVNKSSSYRYLYFKHIISCVPKTLYKNLLCKYFFSRYSSWFNHLNISYSIFNCLCITYVNKNALLAIEMFSINMWALGTVSYLPEIFL